MNAVASKQRQALKMLCRRNGKRYLKKQSFARHVRHSINAFQLLLLFDVMELSVRVKKYQSITSWTNYWWNGKPRKPTESHINNWMYKLSNSGSLVQYRHSPKNHMTFKMSYDTEKMFDSLNWQSNMADPFKTLQVFRILLQMERLSFRRF